MQHAPSARSPSSFAYSGSPRDRTDDEDEASASAARRLDVLARCRGRVGTALSGGYRLLRLLAIGGMGAVYEAEDRVGERVAIKVLHEHFVGDPEVEPQFAREARVTQGMRSAAIVPVLKHDVDANGCPFLVMPLLRGETVGARVARSGGQLPVAEVVRIGLSVLDALANAHDAGVVHCDVKPDNVFVTSEGELRLLDFGIARALGDPRSAPSGKPASRVLGTPGFMAPESVAGRDQGIDARTDVWAVGAMMFTLIAGRPIHVARTARAALARTTAHPPPSLLSVAPHTNPLVAAIVDRALQRAQGARWSDARAMADALRKAAGTEAPLRLARLDAPLPEGGDRVGPRVEPTLRLMTTRTAPLPRSARPSALRWAAGAAAVAVLGVLLAHSLTSTTVGASRTRVVTSGGDRAVASR